ncbi:hypothetical protein C8R45DRAFT_352917 [Mycena sanguinolenta]|nr:hypothetical protein C8R45DRAFT_352917 [Mycena sanguinolenta]
MEMIASNISATALPYTTTAGWDDTKTCLVGTRRPFTDVVLHWVHQPDLHGTQQIFLLADVVGSGKTALAHTIAEKCSDLGLLISAFFFDSKPGQNNPRSFVFNLARDLASRFPQVAENISQALKGDPNMLLSQPVSRLFKALVFQPVIATNIAGPLVVVIDALNEAESAEMQNILRTQIPKFPGNFRVFVTSRPDRSVLRGLGPEIAPVDLAIHGAENRADIAVYVDYKLAEISLEHNLDNWPDPQLITEFLDRAEGLFIWVAIICEYLMQVSCPDRMLERLLASMREAQLLPEQKIDQLYSTVLDGPQWDDIDFLEGYPQVMGTLVVQRIPMTVDALQQLHGSMPRVRNILFPMASLITGLHSSIQPARILHTSFREYITQRAKGKRQIQAKFHHGRLVTLCLELLNTLFSAKIIGCGYMQSRRWSEIENVEVEHFTEEQWYAVEFWIAHLVQVGTPTPEIITALRKFLSRHLATWIEVVVSKRRYQSLIPIRKWVEAARATLVGHITHKGMSNPLRRLPKRLAQDGRHNEALQVIEDLKDMTKNRRSKPAVNKEGIGSKREDSDEGHRTKSTVPIAIRQGSESSLNDSMPSLPSVSNSSDDDESDSDTTSSWSDSDSE